MQLPKRTEEIRQCQTNLVCHILSSFGKKYVLSNLVLYLHMSCLLRL